MIPVVGGTPIYLYAGAADLRKGFDGLSALVRAHLSVSPLSGGLFVFVNRRRDRVKILYWDRDGLAVWYKRLERGCFRLPGRGGGGQELSRADLAMLLEGITPAAVSRRYQRA